MPKLVHYLIGLQIPLGSYCYLHPFTGGAEGWRVRGSPRDPHGASHELKPGCTARTTCDRLFSRSAWSRNVTLSRSILPSAFPHVVRKVQVISFTLSAYNYLVDSFLLKKKKNQYILCNTLGKKTKIQSSQASWALGKKRPRTRSEGLCGDSFHPGS